MGRKAKATNRRMSLIEEGAGVLLPRRERHAPANAVEEMREGYSLASGNGGGEMKQYEGAAASGDRLVNVCASGLILCIY